MMTVALAVDIIGRSSSGRTISSPSDVERSIRLAPAAAAHQ